MQNDYSAFTSERVFRNEMRIVIPFLQQGLSKEEIRSHIVEQNLFHMRSQRAITKTLAMVQRRIACLDETLQQMFLHGSRNDSLAILLYAFLTVYRLPREFFLEVVYYNWKHRKKNRVTFGDILTFFEQKAEQSPVVSGWSTETKRKLRQIMLNLLIECGLLEKEGNEWRVMPLAISESLRTYVSQHSTYQVLLTYVLYQ
ncbi:putative inner membrane protein DUF1819 [Aneurinibacillus soli]|uniref:Uncharacterized protein n=1 Tax=Aneurinibacillus soli TaxID=1500254 RepID=A0A0U4WNA3_9BACL|nr:DUF1819 family protein [Aneurinibacillus soli]PYE61922.1 putative inner membrane protein DUF1819 [Aneurinibacillus soli]BAU29739.1 hypothetical protein CB4_03976 [Aneurinibacillus soli]